MFFIFFHIDYLGLKWVNKKGRTKLTPRLIFDGLKKEAETQLRLSCEDPMQTKMAQEKIDEAILNFQKTWEDVFDTLPPDL